MQPPVTDLMTLREIARECGVRTHVAKYAIAEYRIEPRQRAGIIRLFSADQLPAIQAAIRRTTGHREATHA